MAVMTKETTFQVRVEGGESTHNRVSVRKVTERLNAIESALTQCAEVVLQKKHKSTGRRRDKTRQLTELFFSDLKFDSFGATIAVGNPDHGLFSSQEITQIVGLFGEVISDILSGNPFKTLLERQLPVPTAQKVLQPFAAMLPTKEDDSTLEVKVGQRQYVLNREAVEPVRESMATVAKGLGASTAVVIASFKHDKHGNPIALADRDSIVLLADSKAAGEEETSFRVSTVKTLSNCEGTVVFNRQLLIQIKAVADGLYLAAEHSLGFSALGDSEDEAKLLLEELMVASYFLYANSPDSELTIEAQQLKRKLKKAVAEAEEAS